MSDFATSLEQQFRANQEAMPGSAHATVAGVRREAFAQFESLGLPTLRHEDWKYTDIRTLRETGYVAIGEKAASNAFDTLELDELDLAQVSSLSVVFIDGRFCARLSNFETLPAGVKLVSLAKLLDAGSTNVLAHMTGHDAPFTALNCALLQDGLLIELEENTVLDEPLHAVFISSAGDEARLNTARLIVKAGNNAQACIVETHTSVEGACGLVNALTEIEAQDDARITHYRVQYDEPGAHHVGNVFITAGRDADVTNYSFAFGGGITRVDINAELVANGANVVLNGLFMVNEDQHIDHHTRIRHQAGLTTSSETYRGIADGNGRGVFNGKIYVAEGAQKIEALQSSKNLLLSDRAEIDTKPELEIYADDVKCAHGATVGQLDEDADFYLRSRGIDKASARAMLMFAFAADISDGVNIEALKHWLELRIVDRTHSAGVNEIESDG